MGLHPSSVTNFFLPRYRPILRPLLSEVDPHLTILCPSKVTHHLPEQFPATELFRVFTTRLTAQ